MQETLNLPGIESCYQGLATGHDKKVVHPTPFWYIGEEDAPNKLYLTNALLHGHHAANPAQAGQLLITLAEKNRTAVPGVIICESIFPKKDIFTLARKLQQHPEYAAVPFIVEGTHLSQQDFNEYKKAPFIDEIIFLNEQQGEALGKKLAFLKNIKQNIRNKPNPQFPEKLAPHQNNRLRQTFKRAFDILVASLALLMLSWLLLLIALAIKLESKGPAFYLSKRAGRGFRIFNFYKFRTMYVGADTQLKELSHLNQYTDEGAIFFKFSNDPRITRVGRFLRRTNLDELPQLFNVLLGGMSLVGNRPLPLYEAASLTTDEWATRFLAPAGLTGMWQIKKRGAADMSVEERINLDIDYAKRSSFRLDCWILLNTPLALLADLRRSNT